MSIINLFGHKIKPIKLRGTGVFNPTPTGKITEHLYAIRQWDVNMWIYSKNHCTIAFDTGYENFPDMDGELAKLSLSAQDIHAVFLTHADVDHAGGISDKNNYFKDALVYLSKDEHHMLLGEEKRFRFGPIQLKNPIKRMADFTLLEDKEIVDIEGIEVQVLATPGHTVGHCCYLVDGQILITGDCIAINQDGGYGFFNFYNMDTDRNMRSIKKLKDDLKDKDIRCICTGHSGYCDNFDKAFAYIDEVAVGTKRRPFDTTAPFDIFD